MSPVPTDPYNFLNGTVADADQVDARFLPLYAALNGALDDTNVAAAGFTQESLAAALMEKLGISQSGAVRRGKSIVATEEARTNAAYGLLATPDRVDDIVLPADGLIVVAYQARWKGSVSDTARAAIHLEATQLRVDAGGGSAVQAARIPSGGNPTSYTGLASCPFGLVGGTGNADAATPTTGMVVGYTAGFAAGDNLNFEVGGVSLAMSDAAVGGPCLIFAAAGTYDVSVRFKSSSGTVTVKDRKLWVWSLAF